MECIQDEKSSSASLKVELDSKKAELSRTLGEVSQS